MLGWKVRKKAIMDGLKAETWHSSGSCDKKTQELSIMQIFLPLEK